MSKKLISILMACLMVMSFAVVASADNNVTLTVGTVDGISAATNTNLDIPIIIDRFPSNDVATIQIAMQLDGYEKVQVKSLGKVQKGDIVVGMCKLSDEGYSAEDIADYASGCSVPATWDLNKDLANAGAAFNATYASTSAEGYYSNDLKDAVAGSSVLFKVRVNKKAGAEGLASLKILSVEFGDSEGKAIACNTTFVNGGVQCTEEVIPDPDPVATTVKTFPKRFYEVDSKTLTTVGLILEGDDYVETATAGIYANGEAFAAAPIAGAEGKSYILVGLQGVTETSKINLGTATQAYVNLGAEDILGAEVTDYTSDATKVTDGDIDGFSEVE